MLDAGVTPDMVAAVNDREQLGDLLTRLRSGRPVRELAESVRERVGDRDAVSFSTISSWCRGGSAPNPRQFAAFEALLVECGVADSKPWLDAVQRIRGADAAGPSPYPGLHPFTNADSAAFNGREALIREAVECLAGVAQHDPGDRTMILVGASGSGKTSLIQAGILPVLGEQGWEAEVIELGDDIAAGLGSLRSRSGPRSVVVVDRLEQLLRPDADPDARADFLTALTDPDRDAAIMLALRADFYDEAASHPELLRVLRSAQVLIGPMSEDELRAAIEGPARAAGSSVPDGLLELVLAESGQSDDSARPAGLLAHLSHALQQTWNHGRRGRMSIGDYHAIGGLAGAIEQSAEAAYDELPPSAREAARQVFLRLVHVSDDGPLTRRSTAREEIDAIAARSEDTVDLVEHLVAARLLTASGPQIEIVHETLLHAWPRLRRWIESARDALRAHAHLRDATFTWTEGGRRDADLARGSALERYESLVRGATVAVDAEEERFVDASRDALQREEQRRRQQVRRLRTLLAGATALGVIVAVLAVVAVVAGRNATAARDEATTARDNARSRQIAVTATSLAEQNPSVAARLAVSAYRVAPTLEARSAVLELGNRTLPRRILGGTGSKSVALSADGNLLATSDAVAGAVELLTRDDTGAHQPAGRIEVGHASYALDFAPGDEILAVGGEGAEVALWDVSDPTDPAALTGPFSGPEGPIQDLGFSPDGSELSAVGTGDGIYRWDVTDRTAPTALPTYDVPSDVTWSLAYSPDGRAIAAADEDDRVHLFRRQGTGRVVSVIDLGDQQGRTVAFSPDSALLAVGSVVNNLFRVWDVSTLRTPVAIPEAEASFTSWVNDVGFSSDGRYAAAGASDNTVKVWDTETWTERATLHHPGLVTQLAFAEDTLTTGATDGTTRVWSVPEDLPITTPGAVFNVSMSPETGVVAGVGAGHLQLLTPGPDGSLSPARQASLEAEKATGGGTISPDGSLVTQGHQDGLLELHRADTDDPHTVEIMNDPEFGGVRDVSWSPDAQVVAAVGDNALRFFDLSNPEQPTYAAEVVKPSRARTLTWHPEARLLAVTYNSGVVRLFDATDPADPVMTAELAESPSELSAVAFHPSGDVLAAGGAEATVELWDVSDPTAPSMIGSPLVGHTSQIQWAAFSPDGERLVATANSGIAWVWDVSTPDQPTDYAILGPAPAAVFGVSFDRDGHRIVAGGLDDRIHVWSIDLAGVIDRICDDIGDPLTEEEWSTHLRGVEFVKPC